MSITIIVAGGLIAVVLALLGVAAYALQAEGAASERNKQAAADAAAVVKSKEVADDVAKMAPADVSRDLDRWMRDPAG